MVSIQSSRDQICSGGKNVIVNLPPTNFNLMRDFGFPVAPSTYVLCAYYMISKSQMCIGVGSPISMHFL